MLAARVLFMLSPAVAILAAIGILAFLLVQAVRYCLGADADCGVVSVMAKAVVRWSLRAGEVAKVAVEAFALAQVDDPCDGGV